MKWFYYRVGGLVVFSRSLQYSEIRSPPPPVFRLLSLHTLTSKHGRRTSPRFPLQTHNQKIYPLSRYFTPPQSFLKLLYIPIEFRFATCVNKPLWRVISLTPDWSSLAQLLINSRSSAQCFSFMRVQFTL